VEVFKSLHFFTVMDVARSRGAIRLSCRSVAKVRHAVEFELPCTMVLSDSTAIMTSGTAAGNWPERSTWASWAAPGPREQKRGRDMRELSTLREPTNHSIYAHLTSKAAGDFLQVRKGDVRDREPCSAGRGKWITVWLERSSSTGVVESRLLCPGRKPVVAARLRDAVLADLV